MTTVIDLRQAFAGTLVNPSVTGLTATGNGAGVDVSGATGPLVADITVGTVTGTSPTCTFKLQESSDNSTFTDVPGAVATQLTAGGVTQQIFAANVLKQYVRLAYTIGGTTPVFPTSARIFGQKKITGTGAGVSTLPQV